MAVATRIHGTVCAPAELVREVDVKIAHGLPHAKQEKDGKSALLRLADAVLLRLGDDRIWNI